MNLTDPRFQNVEKAREWFEMQRWPDGPTCSHCGSYSVTGLQGKAHRPGVYQCNDCREQFTVTTGSVMERSKIPLNKWLMAMHLMASSKKGYSAHQLHRTLGITYQSAWFLAHRIREAMRDAAPGPIGGSGKIVEADETYFGDKDRVTHRTKRGKSGHGSKRSVVALVERGGQVRTFHIERATAETVRDVIVRNVSRKSALLTDESRLYIEVGKEFASHDTVRHTAGEYVRYEADRIVHTNTVENVFSVFCAA
jgi:transposase-like protein